MPQLEELKIFLASPSDVPKERDYVEEVVAELNDTVAVSKGIVLRVIHSGKAHPGYNKDGGQAVLNTQIGNMGEYALFIGIMWKRIGTKTPRAESGTVEEFERAEKAHKSKEQPDIWFYFRQSAAQINTQEELQQWGKVLAFKEKLQGKALIRHYKNPSNFRDQFYKELTLWLNARASKTLKFSAVTSSRSKKSSATLANSQSSTTTVARRKKSDSTPTVKKRLPANSSSTKLATRSVSSSGAWVLLKH